jgi:HlyD family secretion protein/epimerase transport system membrane fusion protein
MSIQNLPALPSPYGLDLPTPCTNFRKPMLAGLTVIAIAFGGFGTWAALAPVSSAVVAQGVVAVESKRKTVQHREGGIVQQVLVREGDMVEAGAVLVRLADTTASAQLSILSSQLDARLAEQARLMAELNGAEAIAFPAAVAGRAEVVAREQDRFAERRKTMDGQTGILRQRISLLESQREGRSRLEDSKRQQLALLKDEIVGLRRLEANGYYPRNKLRAQERELARMEGEMFADGAGATQSDKEIGENRLQIIQLEQKFREDITTELAKVETEVNDLAAKLSAARDAVKRLDVVAPVGGAVQSVKVAGPGSVVGAGGEVAEIVPDQDRLVVEAQFSPQDADNVHQGQDAEVRFSAFSSRTTPVLKGSVQMVSADRFTDKNTQHPYYQARIEVSKEELARLPLPLKAGMPAEVMITTGQRTPLEFLLKPLMDSFARGFNEV